MMIQEEKVVQKVSEDEMERIQIENRPFNFIQLHVILAAENAIFHSNQQEISQSTADHAIGRYTPENLT